MTFSIIIPTYNGADFVEQALKSALNQTRPADEIVVSDDNSDDETLNICGRYSEKIKIYKNPKGPSGFVNGWNNAIAHATCEYVSILHQDDLLASTFLEEAAKALTKYPQALHLFVPCNYIDENGIVLQNPDYCNNEVLLYTENEYVNAYCNIGSPHIHRCPGVITHREVFNKCKYRTEAGHIADDDFFFRVGHYTDVVGILSPLASYRIHQKSETGHLPNRLLVRRLYRDYGFLLKDYKERQIGDNSLYTYLRMQKYTFLRHLYGYGIRYGYLSDILYSFKFLF